MLTVGRIAFAPDAHIQIVDTRPCSRATGVIGVEQLLRVIGIVRRVDDWPLPCLDINTLHQRNAARIRARKKGT